MTTPLRAIRAFCLHCLGSAQEVRMCTGNDPDETGFRCTLYPFRFGTNPHIRRRKASPGQLRNLKRGPTATGKTLQGASAGPPNDPRGLRAASDDSG